MSLFKSELSKPISFLISFCFWVGLSSNLQAQSVFEQIGRLPVSVYASEEYGGSPSVWSAIQSEDGLMYFGTNLGLHEYDGVSWRSLFGRNDAVGVRTFAKDEKGRIYYGGQGFGYLSTNSRGETESVSLGHLIPEELSSGNSFFSINFLNNYLFLQSREILIRLELEEDFTLKSLKSWSSETTFTYVFLQGDKLFIHQNEKGLYQLIGEEIQLVPGTEILGKDSFRIMLPYPSERGTSFLMGGFNTGLYLFDGKSVSKMPSSLDSLIQGGAGLLYNAIPFHGNYIFAFSGKGIVITNSNGEILRKIDSDQGLPSDVVRGVYLDQSEGLWVMTEDGIARIEINSPIQTFGKEQGVNSGVLSIQKKGSEFFLGTSNGLVRFDSDDREFQSLPILGSNQIFDLRFDGDDLIVPGSQLQVYRSGKAIRLDNPKDGSRPNFLMIPRQNSNLLLVGTSTGLLIYQRGLSKEFPWEYKGKLGGVGTVSTLIYEGMDGTIFLGGGGKLFTLKTDEMGLESIDPQTIKSKAFEVNSSDFYSFIDGEFYRSSPQGVMKYSGEEGQFVSAEDFREIEKDIYDLNQTKSGQVWYESMNGKKYLLKRDSVGKFTKYDTPSAVTPYLSMVEFMDEEGISWFGSPKGLVRYDPKKDNQTDKEFFTLIRRIETKTDTLSLIASGRDKSLSAVGMKDNSYRFEFAAPYYEDEKKTKYQTYLEGFDPEWVDWNDNRFKEYTNLSPGAYTFHVRAMAYTGRISEEAVYSFVVLAPWYATWWAYIIYALLVGGFIAAIVKWRSQKLKEENRILEERVKERTAALEKSINDLKSTQAQLIQSEKMASLGELTAGIAHEIQNPLNFVNNFSELGVEIIDEMNEEIEKGDMEGIKALASDLKENLSKIHHHGKRAGSIVRGMLAHSRKSSTDKDNTDINALVDECLRLSFHGLRAKDKSFSADFKTELDPDLPKAEVVTQDIGRVILNLINNAFYAVNDRAKKGEPDYKPSISVSTKHLDGGNGIKISVWDNGLGIPESIKEKIFQPFFTTKPTGEGTGLGLSLSYDIIKAHGGELNVESKVGQGTTFSVILPR